jgi:mono/diheme cytochrome c family protein
MIKLENLAVMLVMVALLGPSVVKAEEAAEGLKLADQWCASCHAIAPGRAGTESAPPFDSIVRERGRSDEWIATWLSTPHEMMPDLTLTRAEIAALVAYFDSLRAAD